MEKFSDKIQCSRRVNGFQKKKLDLIPFLHQPGSVPKCLVSSAQRGRRGKLKSERFDFLDLLASLARPFVSVTDSQICGFLNENLPVLLL